jgi:hypothetical protein
MNLLQKLHNIQEKVSGLGKDKDTKSQHNPNGFKYVTGDKVISAIKPLMNTHKLILKQEVVKMENQPITYVNAKGNNKTEVLTSMHFKFTWIDTESGEREECLFAANGMNEFDKSAGSAITYSQRYFLLKFFLIATDEDDVDAIVREYMDSQPSQPAPKKVAITTEKVDGLVKWMKDNKKTIDQAKDAYDISADIEKQINDKLK